MSLKLLQKKSWGKNSPRCSDPVAIPCITTGNSPRRQNRKLLLMAPLLPVYGRIPVLTNNRRILIAAGCNQLLVKFLKDGDRHLSDKIKCVVHGEVHPLIHWLLQRKRKIIFVRAFYFNRGDGVFYNIRLYHFDAGNVLNRANPPIK